MLLVRRNAQLAFHGGAWVFPGGRVDAADYAGERRHRGRRAPRRRARSARGSRARAACGRSGRGVALGDADPVAEAFRHLVLRRRRHRCAGRGRRRRDPRPSRGWRRTRRSRRSAPARIELPPPTFVTITAHRAARQCARRAGGVGARPDRGLRAAPLPDRGRRRDALRRRRRLRRTPSSNAPARGIDCGSATTAGATNGPEHACSRSGAAHGSVPSTWLAVFQRPPVNFGAPLLHEGQHPFLGVLGLGHQRLRHRLVVERGLEVDVERAVEQALRHADGERRAGGEALGPLAGGGLQLIGGDDRLTRPMRCASSAGRSSPKKTSSFAFARPIRRGSRKAPPASTAMPRRTKTSMKRASADGDDEVAGEGEVRAEPGGDAVHRRDDRLLELPEGADQALRARAHHLARGARTGRARRRGGSDRRRCRTPCRRRSARRRGCRGWCARR